MGSATETQPEWDICTQFVSHILLRQQAGKRNCHCSIGLQTPAEQALRGAVIARKVSHCSEIEDGTGALTSILRTPMRRSEEESLVDALCNVFSGAPFDSPP